MPTLFLSIDVKKKSFIKRFIIPNGFHIKISTKFKKKKFLYSYNAFERDQMCQTLNANYLIVVEIQRIVCKTAIIFEPKWIIASLTEYHRGNGSHLCLCPAFVFAKFPLLWKGKKKEKTDALDTFPGKIRLNSQVEGLVSSDGLSQAKVR